MRVNELLVDPVAAALRQPIDVQLADCEHHLTHAAVHLIAIDVDIGEVVVGANLLNLAERVLQRPPVPEPDVLERVLIVVRFDSGDARVGGKRHLFDPVQRKGGARLLDVVRDERRLPDQLVGLDDEAVHVPADRRHAEIQDDRRNQGGDDPAKLRRRDGVDQHDDRAEHERERHPQHAGNHHVRVGVGDSRENRVVLEDAIESSEIHAQRARQQDGREGNRAAAQH